MPTFNVIGTAHICVGFDYIITAETEDKARAIAYSRAHNLCQYEYLALDEVCINEVEIIKDNLIEEW